MTQDEDIIAFTAKRVVEYMEVYNVSVNELHEVTGIARTTINEYVHGTTVPTLYFLGLFLDYIEVSVSEFFAPYKTKHGEENYAGY